ncbi:hypothetical protein MRB53_040204 [Persea americana]|nr:hypothetical protein MRB53_040204 [Persea americana]
MHRSTSSGGALENDLHTLGSSFCTTLQDTSLIAALHHHRSRYRAHLASHRPLDACMSQRMSFAQLMTRIDDIAVPTSVMRRVLAVRRSLRAERAMTSRR